MTGDHELADRSDRERALDPRGSFIVQAPAGSGKTELLIQRFLRLLGCVEEPEEVLAVTFTRKAAGEMRSRVISALRQAESGAPPPEAHLRRSWELARDILGDERRRGWQLPRHPARLSISTIDSVNAWLAGRAPLASGGSAARSVTDAPEELYREAAVATLALVAEPGGIGASVAALLRHVDNDAARFVRLIVAMLPRRDQWLRHVLAAGGDRSALEAPLRELTAHGLRRAAACIDAELATVLAGLLAFAAGVLGREGRQSDLQAWAGRDAFPAAEAGELAAWKALAGALLTASGGEWRKTVTIRNGFPPGTPEKKRMEQLLRDCAGNDELMERLRDVRELPGPAYADDQWQILLALIAVLRLAAAELRLVLAARGTSDFPEIAASALAALGAREEPSELGLALDHRIRHILVDEFQDTSLSQFDLLRQLVAGWEPGDGRTIFLVGDPMQSIYRFREAEVGLFMQVRDEGLGEIKPESLRLRVNFRSRPEVVTWINTAFGQTFPERDDPILGAVRFSPCAAARCADASAGVSLHWLPAADDRAEARRVVEIIAAARAAPAGGSICVLVRNRGHAARILPALREAGIAFVAPDLENMEHASAAQDLLALTRALGNPADRLAWIGILRAPWCGLSLADLDALLGADHELSVSEILCNEQSRRLLSADGAAAIARLIPVVARAGDARGRRPLRELVEGAWLDLGGPATLREAAEMETAEAFLALLESVDAGGDCPDPIRLGELMSRRHGSLGSGDPGVQVMTMHRAKGLEFDTVILPGLGKPPRGDEPPVLAWQQVPVATGRAAPVLAPMAPTGVDGDPLHRYLGLLERRKQAFETDRLLYVACTRARNRLHLLAQLSTSREPLSGALAVRAPRSGSLLQHLWPAVKADANAAAGVLPPADDDADDARVWVQPPLRRLRSDWRAPPAAVPLRVAGAQPAAGADAPVVYEWASSWAMQVGSVVHRWLQIIARQGVGAFDRERIESHRADYQQMLEQLGTGPADMERATRRVIDALVATIGDERGRWILSGEHLEAESELPLTVCEGDGFRHFVIDRTFVEQSGCRWIVDFKTGTHEGADVEAFLRLESERHREQLLRYRDAVAKFRPGEIRTALYFPLLTAFREIRADAGSVAPQG